MDCVSFGAESRPWHMPAKWGAAQKEILQGAHAAMGPGDFSIVPAGQHDNAVFEILSVVIAEDVKWQNEDPANKNKHKFKYNPNYAIKGDTPGSNIKTRKR